MAMSDVPLVEVDHPVQPGDDVCWSKIGVAGDRSCPELKSFIHCRNCPVFATAARNFFDRPAPEGYLATWSRWLAGAVNHDRVDEGRAGENDDAHAHETRASV